MKYWWIPKAVSVRTEKPFTVITEYETGEIKRLDMTRFIEKTAKLKPLAAPPNSSPPPKSTSTITISGGKLTTKPMSIFIATISTNMAKVYISIKTDKGQHLNTILRKKTNEVAPKIYVQPRFKNNLST